MNAVDLNGQRAVVTGGANGIGYAVAERLCRSGATVAIWDMDTARGESAATELGNAGKAVFHAVDVTDPDSVARTLVQTEQDIGPVDIAVNSAGIAGMNATVEEYPIEEWNRVIDINLNGTFYVNRAVVPGMRERNYGRICNIASIAGKEGNPNAAAYSASKGGVIALTKSLGKELAAYNVAVNCVTPAAARTRIFDQMTQEHIDFMLSKIPRNRFVEVEEIASMIAWIVSRENSFTTAAVFDISGGRATY
ncbi:MAG: SDR family oxidoreductase [Alphaproteobacteria bacterium]|nr:SDR family oxidoreductase [Alphaproteobacteria bacterium]